MTIESHLAVAASSRQKPLKSRPGCWFAIAMRVSAEPVACWLLKRGLREKPLKSQARAQTMSVLAMKADKPGSPSAQRAV